MSNSVIVRRLTGTNKGKEENHQTQELSFGTGSNNTVRFDPTWDRGVATSHARVWSDESGAWWLKDAGSSTGTFLNGQRITMQRQVGGAFVIELGQGGPKVEVTVPAAPPRAGGGPGMSARNATRVAQRGGSMKWLALAGCLVVAGGGAWFFMGQKGASSSMAKSEPSKAESSAINLSWEPRVDMDGQIFPSYLVAIATMNQNELPNAKAANRLGDPGGIIGVNVTSPEDHAKVTVSVEPNVLMKGGSIEVGLAKKGEAYTVYPKMDYLYEALLKVRQAVPLTLTAKVAFGGAEESKAVTVRVSSVNDCPFAVRSVDASGKSGMFPCPWMFAAYVNENHPYSEEIRKEALKTGIVDSFSGYQVDEEGVLLQVFAIWNVLQQRGVRYSNVTTTSGKDENVFAQQVRFVDQTITSSQANCVDGSVIFASILRQIGIEPVLVVVPGHMFVGFYPKEDDRDTMVFLETTAMGHADLSQISSLKALPAAVQKGVESLKGNGLTKAQYAASRESFFGALTAGLEKFRAHKESILKNQGMVGLIDIQSARKLGVMPIAFQP